MVAVKEIVDKEIKREPESYMKKSLIQDDPTFQV